MTQEKIRNLSETEKKELRTQLVEQLKWLNTPARSDWHAGFEAYLKADALGTVGGKAEVIVEHSLGEEPPRIDFIVWMHSRGVELGKTIYKIFRQFNVIEYKNPKDELNWRVIRKVIGYANLYMGLAEHDGDRPINQITASIFRAVKNPDLFMELEETGHLIPDQGKGIYHIEGLTDFPFQIVIMSELEGEEYAAARAMIDGDRARIEDIEHVMASIEEEQNEVVRNHMRVILNLIGNKNPGKLEIVRRNKTMENKWMEIFKPTIDAEKKRDLFIFVQDGQMTPEYAAGRMNLPVSQFISEMIESGFQVPHHSVVTTTI